MSGETVHVQLSPAGLLPASFPVVLKKILEMPPPNILDGEDDTEKEKLGLRSSADLGGSSDMGPSAALTPAIWEKTIPYDGESFHLEYMELEEFLLENNISSSPDALKDELAAGMEEDELIPPEEMKVSRSADVSAVTLMPIQELDKSEELLIITKSDCDVTCEVSTEVVVSKHRATPVDPDDVEVEVNYEPDPTDLVLSSIPGGDLFDPRKHKFSEDELKPQPMIKKAKKVFVPEDQKDEKYWQRRTKNNVAANRSRAARRLKENQITVRAAFLERENTALRSEVVELRKECGRYQNVVSRYKDRFGPL